MSGQIVLFGATGYTGRLVAGELVDAGARPILAGRDANRLAELDKELGGGLETRTADVTQPRSVAELVEHGDVLVTTVGPFVRWGQPAAVAAATRGATYFDSTGEGQFVREMIDRVGPQAEASGCALVPAFGYDYVPGNLAGAMALHRAGAEAARVEVAYFALGAMELSGGTAASSVGILLAPSFRFVRGAIAADRQGARTRTFSVGGSSRSALAIGGTEHLFLPPLAPGVAEVGVYLGWFGPLGRLAPAGSLATRGLASIPGLASSLARSASKFRSSSGGPDARSRARATTNVVATAYDAAGAVLARVELTGPSPYTLTGRLLAWAAREAVAGRVTGSGVLGPVQAFGLDALTSGCASLGLVEVETA